MNKDLKDYCEELKGKPREFWISPIKQMDTVLWDVSTEEPINKAYVHVREVVPIDWDKLFEDYREYPGIVRLTVGSITAIKELVEKALRGEL